MLGEGKNKNRPRESVEKWVVSQLLQTRDCRDGFLRTSDVQKIGDRSEFCCILVGDVEIEGGETRVRASTAKEKGVGGGIV